MFKHTMKHVATAQVEAYWEALRGDRLAPLRSEVDPRGIDQALEHAFILERIAPGVARFRLAGMHLNDLMGMEVRGMPMTTFFCPDARRSVSDCLEHVFEEPAKARFLLQGEHRTDLRAEMILLPLRSDLGDTSRALGCMVSEGALRKPPHRFELVSSDVASLPCQKGADPVNAAAAPGFAEARSAYGAGRPPRSRGHLRLVHTRDTD